MSDEPVKTEKLALAKKACPICGRPRDAKFDPFCSRRCADVDLYRWLKGTYVIPGAERPSVEADKGEDDE